MGEGVLYYIFFTELPFKTVFGDVTAFHRIVEPCVVEQKNTNIGLTITIINHPVNTLHWPNAGAILVLRRRHLTNIEAVYVDWVPQGRHTVISMLGHSLRRWPNSRPVLIHCVVSVGMMTHRLPPASMKYSLNVGQCCSTVCDAGTTLKQHWGNVSYLTYSPNIGSMLSATLEQHCTNTGETSVVCRPYSQVTWSLLGMRITALGRDVSSVHSQWVPGETYIYKTGTGNANKRTCLILVGTCGYYMKKIQWIEGETKKWIEAKQVYLQGNQMDLC